VLTLKSRGDFPPPTDFYPEIPEVVLRALNGALAVELEDRFRDVGAFRRALEGVALEAPAVVAAQAPKAEAELESEAAIEPTDPGLSPASTSPKPESKFPILGFVAVAVILFGVFYSFTNTEPLEEASTPAPEEWIEEAAVEAVRDPMPAVKSWQPPKTENAVYYKTSYPCENSTQADEFAICENPTLARLDLEMADKYKAVKRHTNNRSALISAQRQTLNERRKCGDDIICIQSVVSTRILELDLELAIRGL
jgi:uncharacterized protein YecT (DUF1311 family)